MGYGYETYYRDELKPMVPTRPWDYKCESPKCDLNQWDYGVI